MAEMYPYIMDGSFLQITGYGKLLITDNYSQVNEQDCARSVYSPIGGDSLRIDRIES